MPYDSKATLVARLAIVRASITTARNAQSYGIEGNTVTKANLRALLDEEKWLLRQIQECDAASTGGASNRVSFGRPT